MANSTLPDYFGTGVGAGGQAQSPQTDPKGWGYLGNQKPGQGGAKPVEEGQHTRYGYINDNNTPGAGGQRSVAKPIDPLAQGQAARNQQKQIQEQIRQLVVEINFFKNQLVPLKAEILQLDNYISISRQKSNDLQNKILQIRTEIDQKKQDILLSEEERRKILEELNREYEKSFEYLNAEKDKIVKFKQAKEKEAHDLQEKRNVLVSEESECRTSVHTNEQTDAQLKQRGFALQQRERMVLTKKSELERKIQEINQEISRLTLELQKIVQKSRQDESQLRFYENEKTRKQQTVYALQSRQRTLGMNRQQSNPQDSQVRELERNLMTEQQALAVTLRQLINFTNEVNSNKQEETRAKMAENQKQQQVRIFQSEYLQAQRELAMIEEEKKKLQKAEEDLIASERLVRSKQDQNAKDQLSLRMRLENSKKEQEQIFAQEQQLAREQLKLGVYEPKKKQIEKDFGDKVSVLQQDISQGEANLVKLNKEYLGVENQFKTYSDQLTVKRAEVLRIENIIKQKEYERTRFVNSMAGSYYGNTQAVSDLSDLIG